MNKNDLVKIVAESASLTQKDVNLVIDEFFAAVQAELVRGEEIAIAGFGKFVVKKRAARESINPRTKEVVKVPASKTVGFRPGKSIKDAVNK